jgi:ATP-dependent Lhr-like helicase
LLTEEVQGPRLLLLGGRSWRVTYVDWTRRQCFVEPAEGGGKARWNGTGIGGTSFALTRAMRAVLLGEDPQVALTRRATAKLTEVREELLATVHPGGTVLSREPGGDVRWWTWAGFRTNATLTATLAGTADPSQRTEDAFIRLREDLVARTWKAATADAAERLCLPEIDAKALHGLKFSAALPERLAVATLAIRLADLDGATAVLREPTRFRAT